MEIDTDDNGHNLRRQVKKRVVYRSKQFRDERVDVAGIFGGRTDYYCKQRRRKL